MNKKAPTLDSFLGLAITWAPPILVTTFWLAVPLAYDLRLSNPYQLPKSALLAIFGTVALALVLLARARRGRALRCPTVLILGLGGFLVAVTVATLRAEVPSEGLNLLRDGWAHAMFAGLGLVLGRRSGALRATMCGVAVSGTAAAALGWAQQLGWDDFGWLATGEPGGAWFASLPQTDRPGSVFGHVNVAAEWVTLGAASKLAMWPSRRWGARALWTAAIGVDASFLVVSGTRAAWISWIVAGAVLLFLGGRRAARLGDSELLWRRAALLGATAIAGFVLLDQWVLVPGRGGAQSAPPRARVLEAVDPTRGTLAERLTLWANTGAMLAARPWCGVGPGNWKIAYPEWARSRRTHAPGTYGPERQPERAHQDLLQMAAEIGLPGAAAMLVFFLVGSKGWATEWGRRRPAVGASAAVAVLASGLGFGAVAFPFQSGAPGPLIFLVLGAGATRVRYRFRLRIPARGLGLLGACALLASVIVAANAQAQRRSSLERRTAEVAMVAARSPGVGTTSAAQRKNALLAALDAADRSAARQPGSYRHQLLRASIRFDLGLGDAAAAAYAQTLALHPNLVQALLGSARLERRLGHDRVADVRYARALALQPAAYDVRVALGLDAEGQGLDATAETHYRRAVGSRAFDPDARLRLAALWVRRQRWDRRHEIAGLLDPVIVQVSNDAERTADLARLFEHPMLGSLDPVLFGPSGVRSRDLWRRAAALSRQTAFDARLEVGLEPLKDHLSGLPQRAEVLETQLRILERLLEERPNDLKARYYRARLLELVGRPEDALIEWAALVRALLPRPSDGVFDWVLASALEASERIRLEFEASSLRRSMQR